VHRHLRESREADDVCKPANPCASVSATVNNEKVHEPAADPDDRPEDAFAPADADGEAETAAARGPDGLPALVLARIKEELGQPGEKVVGALRTAAHLIALARNDDTGLRLAESAAYNLREAFDAVVYGRPEGEDGFRAVQAAWLRYKLAVVGPDADEHAALREFHGVIERLTADEEHQAYRTQKLIAQLVEQTGVEPLPGKDAPTRQYTRLRRQAANTLHSHGAVSDVAALYDDTISWFTRFFTPPDDRVRKISALAQVAYEGVEQIEQLRTSAYNTHHISLFLTEVKDPAWLDPLYDATLIMLPRDGEPWPINFLIGGTGNIDPGSIAGLLKRLLDSTKDLEPERRLSFARDIIQTASRLGPAGHSLANTIVTTHPSDHWVQMIAVHIARDAAPTDEIVEAVADAVIGNERPSDGGYYTRTTLEQLADGITLGNARQRVGMVTAKIRRMSEPDLMRFRVLDTAALGTPGDDLRDTILILAQHLVGMIATWRDLGLPTKDLLAMVSGIDGEIGERIVCQVLAGAIDVVRADKINHLAMRLASLTVTGDDRDLLADLGELGQSEITLLADAFGTPSPEPKPDPAGVAELPYDWARAWRWSLLLPHGVLARWEQAIAAVTARRGEPQGSALDNRIPRFITGRPKSPYTTEQLAELAPVQAAGLVAAWRPGEEDGWWGNSVWELASTLENVIKDDVPAWIADPEAVVKALREPGYIERYLRAITTKPKETGVAMPAILQTVRVIREQRWERAKLSASKTDPDIAWDSVDRTIVEMIGTLANNEANLHAEADLDLAWDLARELARDLPDDLGDIDAFADTSRGDDPLSRAVNRPHSKGLEAALWLGWWERRNLAQARPALATILDEALEIPGAVGAEMRAIVAANRHIVEHIAHDWMERRADDLFGGDLGSITFDQTLTWGRPTPWFLGRFPMRLAAASLRGVDHAAAWVLLGHLWEEPGYSTETIIESYDGDVEALKAAAKEMASLVQDIEPDDPMRDRALQFWDGLVDADRAAVPAAALVGLGRWIYVAAVGLEDWLDRMDRTLQLTGGAIDMPIEVADRCKEAQPSEQGLRMLRLMQGHGETWEKAQIAGTAADALRTASGHGIGPEFNRLRDRLLELGHIDVRDIPPERA
jgi:hypothetical protein